MLSFAVCQRSGLGQQFLDVPAQGREETWRQRGFRSINHWYYGVLVRAFHDFRRVAGHFTDVNCRCSGVRGDYRSVGGHFHNVDCHCGGVSRYFDYARGRCDDTTGNLGNVTGGSSDVIPDFGAAIVH